jgi:carbon-monoxide dehydrogenase iron sulfur subunit
MKEIFIDIERCTACKSCEIACVVQHSASKNLFTAIFETPAPRKRVHVEKALSFSYPVKCMHCDDAPCIVACPAGAMYRDTEIGSVHVNKDRCMGCWMCAMVCPFGAISADPYRKVALKCDFCRKRVKEGKKPECVEACPTHALTFGDTEELFKSQRLSAAERVARAVSITKEEKKVTPLEMLRSMGGV